MDPDAAADLLADLSQDRTEQILVEMKPEASQEVVELLEHSEETAAGRMTTEFLALPVTATVENAIGVMREFEGGIESVSTIYLVDSHGTLVGAVPLVKLVLAKPDTPLLSSDSRTSGPDPQRNQRQRSRRTFRQIQPGNPPRNRRTQQASRRNHLRRRNHHAPQQTLESVYPVKAFRAQPCGRGRCVALICDQFDV